MIVSISSMQMTAPQKTSHAVWAGSGVVAMVVTSV
jgi:hypothetical protein